MDGRFETLTERQRTYLRMVHNLCSSQEIAFHTGETESTINGQIKKACRKLGAHGRIEAARQFHDYERRVQLLDPGGSNYASRPQPLWPLPWVMPSRAGTLNVMTRQQVISWALIVSIGIPMAVTVAAMLIIAISFLLGTHA